MDKKFYTVKQLEENKWVNVGSYYAKDRREAIQRAVKDLIASNRFYAEAEQEYFNK